MTGSRKVAEPRKRNPRDKREFNVNSFDAVTSLISFIRSMSDKTHQYIFKSHLIYVFTSQGRGAEQEGKGETREASQKAPGEREGNAGGHEKKVIMQLIIYNENSVPVVWSQEKIFNIMNVDRSESKLQVLKSLKVQYILETQNLIFIRESFNKGRL